MKSKTIKLFLFTFLMCLGSVVNAQIIQVLASENYENLEVIDWTCPNGLATLNTDDATYGNYAYLEAQGSGNRSAYKSVVLGDVNEVYIDKYLTTEGYNVEFDAYLRAGQQKDRSSSQFVIPTTGPNFETNKSYTGTDYIFSLSQPTNTTGSASKEWYINDLTNTVGEVVNLEHAWYHFLITVTKSKVSYEITSGENTIASGAMTTNYETLPTIKGFWTLLGRTYGSVRFDNLEIYCYKMDPSRKSVLYERGTTTAWSETDLTEWIGNYGTIEISGGVKYTSPDNGGGDYTKQLITQDNSIVRVAASWNTGGSTGRSGNYNFLKCGDVEFRSCGQDQKGYIYIGSENILLTSTEKDVRYNAIWEIDLEINKATGAVNYSVKLPNEGTKKGKVYIANASFNELKIGFVRGGRTGTSTSTIKAIEVTEELQTVATAEYTVKYIANGNEIKESVTKSGVIGAPVILENTDKENFFNDDKSMKYIYVSDDASEKIIAEDGSTIVTIAFREAETYNYTINAVDAEGKQLKVLKTGSNFEGETSRAYVSKGLNIDGVWYITSGNGSYPTYGYDFKEETTKDVTYIIDESVDYFFEVEDINTSRSWAARGAYPERYSNGLTGRLYKGAYAYTEALVGGVYTIKMWARNNSSSAVANVGLYYRDSEGNATSLGVGYEDWTTGLSALKTLENVIIPNGASLMLKNENPDYNSNLEMDYLILQKTGEIQISLTLTSAGVGTICSPYNLDFTNAENIAAYKAETSEGRINLTRVYNVAAREGVLIRSLNGGAVTEDIPVAATAYEPNEGNEFIGTLVDIASQPSEDEEYRYYILSSKTVNGNKVYGFYLANNKKIGAGKAYLRVPLAAAAKYSFFSFDDETTGVEDIELGITEADSPVYDLFGRKVVNPATGLYIKNGKKFIVK